MRVRNPLGPVALTKTITFDILIHIVFYILHSCRGKTLHYQRFGTRWDPFVLQKPILLNVVWKASDVVWKALDVVWEALDVVWKAFVHGQNGELG